MAAGYGGQVFPFLHYFRVSNRFCTGTVGDGLGSFLTSLLGVSPERNHYDTFWYLDPRYKTRNAFSCQPPTNPDFGIRAYIMKITK